MTYQTNNPVGSVDVRDLYDNAEAFDNFSAGPLDAYPDRFGVPRQSLQGIRNASQYVDLGPYAAGMVFTSRNQVFSYLGEYYAPGPAIVLPYTTTGVGAAEIANFRSVGDAVLRQDLLAPDGAELVGYSGRTVSEKLGESISVKDFGAVGDGATNDTAAVINARTAAIAGNYVLYFPAGNFALSALDLGFSGLKVRCEPDTILTHTGTGKFITFDAGSGLEGYFYDIHFTGYPTIQGNINTTDAIYIRSSHHMRIDVNVRDCDCAIRADFTVLSDIRVDHSVNHAPWAIKQPVNTVILDQRIRIDAAIEAATANYLFVISEGVSGAGILLNSAQANHITGGTSEGNGIGIDLKANSAGNRIDNLFMEANSVKDVSDGTSYTEYNNCYAGSPAGSIIGSGFKRRVIGGYFKSLVIDTPAGFTRLSDVNLVGTFANNSINTILDGCHNLGTAIANRPNGIWKATKGGVAQGSIATTVWTKVTFTTEVEDSLSIYDAANSRAIPRAGYYEFTATVSINAGVVDSGIYGVAIFKNGARIAEILQHASGVNQISISVTAQDRTDGSGTYEVYAYGNGAGDKTVGGHAAESWFSGKYLLD